jgi:hypothetical protein
MLRAGIEIGEIPDDEECVRALEALHQEAIEFSLDAANGDIKED